MLIACPECSKEISDTAPSCPHCGHRSRVPRQRIIYIILAIVFGLLGIHDLYIGRWQRTLGFLALLFVVSPATHGGGIVIAYAWIVAECVTMKTDAEGHALL